MNTDWLSLVAAWLVTYTLHSTLLLLVAWIATRLPALRAPRAAEVVWRTALFGGVLTACVHVFLGAPLWRAPIVERPAQAVLPVALETPEEVAPVVAPVVEERAALPALEPPAASAVAALSSAAWSPTWLLLLWPAGWLLVLGRGRRIQRRLAKALACRREASTSDLGRLLDRLALEAGVTRPVRLTISTTLPSPVALGTRRPEVCLPERAVETLAPRHLEVMLAHEVAHIARADPLWLGAYRLVQGVFFFQPLNHLAVARLRDTSEMLCDARAAPSQPRRVALAECLTIVADWIVAAAPPQGAVAMARKTSRLVDRVHELLDAPRRRVSPGRAYLGVLALAPLLLVMAFAPGLQAVAAPPGLEPTLGFDEPLPTAGPVAALDRELALLAAEVEELTALLDDVDRPALARRIETRLESLMAQRDVLLRALAAEGR